ncbi:uncharacterized protein ATC70_013482 [Mucor velutinosus]|uniref:Uncharacterized protein n=1 Tax=Mucor velutinosus TaxID=708070 RepID=A0AAN7D3E1_9FUNG|nr:hypothetical protein ATC70_013482 [Mucor velutinosus]
MVSQLQQENLQLRIDKAKKPKRRKKAIPRKRAFDAVDQSQPLPPPPPPSSSQPLIQPPQQENIPSNSSNNNNMNNSKEHTVNDLIITTHSKRSCNSKPISYVLPSSKCKLRKGDPYTFGNE